MVSNTDLLISRSGPTFHRKPAQEIGFSNKTYDIETAMFYFPFYILMDYSFSTLLAVDFFFLENPSDKDEGSQSYIILCKYELYVCYD